MNALGAFLAKWFGGKVGSVVADVAVIGAIVAAITPAILWIVGKGGNEVFVEITYRQGVFGFGILAVIVLIVKYSQPPQRNGEK